MRLINQASWLAIKNLLAEHYGADPFPIFKQFRSGAIAFGAGLMMIFYAQTAMDASVIQELVVVSGLVLGCTGFVIAMLAQVRMVIGRFVRFFTRKD